MDTIEKSKNKGRPYPLRRVLLVMLAGVAFMFWMPFVIITDNYFHWLNYVIYWGAALVWVAPFLNWLKRYAYLSRVQRFRIMLFLFGIWLFLLGGGWFVMRRGLLPPIHDNDLRCIVHYEQDYEKYWCEIPARTEDRQKIRHYWDTCLNQQVAYLECYFVTSFVIAELPDGFPLARTTYVHTDIYFASELYIDTVGVDG